MFLEFRTQEADFQPEDAERGNNMKQAWMCDKRGEIYSNTYIVRNIYKTLQQRTF